MLLLWSDGGINQWATGSQAGSSVKFDQDDVWVQNEKGTYNPWNKRFVIYNDSHDQLFFNFCWYNPKNHVMRFIVLHQHAESTPALRCGCNFSFNNKGPVPLTPDQASSQLLLRL